MLVESLNVEKFDGGVQIVFASQEVYLVIVLIIFFIGYLVTLVFRNKDLTKKIGIYKNVYENISDKNTLLEVENAKSRADFDKVEENNQKLINKLNTQISALESENYIYLKQLNEFKDKHMFSEKEKFIFLSNIVSQLFGNKTQNFIKMIDSETLDDKEKIEFFKTFFADIIPLIKYRDSSLKNIGNGYTVL